MAKKKVKKEKSKPDADPQAAIEGAFKMVNSINMMVTQQMQNQQQQAMELQQQQLAMAMQYPGPVGVPRQPSLAQQDSTVRSQMSQQRPDFAANEELQQRVQELQEWKDQQQVLMEQKETERRGEAERMVAAYAEQQRQLRQQHEAAEAAAAAEAEAEKLELSELTESARLDVVAQQKASAAAEAELRAAQAQSALHSHLRAQQEAHRRAEAEAGRAQAEAEAKQALQSEVSDLRQTVEKLQEQNAAMSQLIKTKNEIVWALLQQQQELKAENEMHCTNFEAYQRQCQEEFKGWIALNDQLDQEISEHKRVDMENRMIIKRMHEELESKWQVEQASAERIEQLEATIARMKAAGHG